MPGEHEPRDVAVVGGGFAGLAAALWLGRFRRSVRVLDTGTPRNDAAWAVHGFPGLPDLPPPEIRRRIRDQALGAGAQITSARALNVTGTKDAFLVHSDDGVHPARRVLLAFGRRDAIPDIDGSQDLYGRYLFHCPDCDGPSMSGARVAVLGHDRSAAALALYLLTWAGDVEILTHGREPRLDAAARATLEREHVPTVTEPIRRMMTASAGGARLVLRSGEERTYDGVFTHVGSRAASDLAKRIGCRVGPDGVVITDAARQTSVPGIFAAGDLTGPPYLAIVAAADGVTAALALHRSLLPQEFEI